MIDEDLGLSGAGVVERTGFARLTAEVALSPTFLLCGLIDTLIGDADGVYHPAMFNDWREELYNSLHVCCIERIAVPVAGPTAVPGLRASVDRNAPPRS